MSDEFKVYQCNKCKSTNVSFFLNNKIICSDCGYRDKPNIISGESLVSPHLVPTEIVEKIIKTEEILKVEEKYLDPI